MLYQNVKLGSYMFRKISVGPTGSSGRGLDYGSWRPEDELNDSSNEESLEERYNSRGDIRDIELAKLFAVWIQGIRENVKLEIIPGFLA